ncbi:MAG: NAD(P)H-hydrate dehydratase [Terrisporobacter sp.]
MIKLRIGTSMSTYMLDEACVNEYKIPLIVLMENAVLSATRHMDSELYNSYVIVSGTGNNGGDGLGIARQLVSKVKKVKVFIIGNMDKITSCSKINYEILKSMNIPIEIIDSKNPDEMKINLLKEEIKNSDIVIDAIFGTGLEREIRYIFKDIINIINIYKKLTYSIDVPSGINSSNGEILGTCIKADKTICFEFYKRGFLKYEVKEYIGEVIVEHLGIPEYILEKYDNKEFITSLELVRMHIKEKNKYSFKSDFGKVAVFAGSKGFSGAAFIASESAVKSGSGLVTLVSDEYVQNIASCKLIEGMTLNFNQKEKINRLIKSCNAIGFGCGMGNNDTTLELLRSTLEGSTCTIVIDADGLNVLNNNCDILSSHKNRIVITPHLGEMSKLTEKSITYIRDNKIDVAKEFAKEYGVIVLLKGYETVITDGNMTYINPTGNSAMANGGMGDCLLGMITSFIGQGMNNLYATVCAAYIHGYIGDHLAKELYTINASDVIKNIPLIMKQLSIEINL